VVLLDVEKHYVAADLAREAEQKPDQVVGVVLCAAVVQPDRASIGVERLAAAQRASDDAEVLKASEEAVDDRLWK